MILNASQRGGGRQLALHLLNTDHNDHVTILEIKGFVSDDVPGAFEEVHAIAKGTKCKQPYFSVQLSPPPDAEVELECFKNVADRIEVKNGLEGHARVIIVHEKDGRLHAHGVWNRINAEEMKAVNLSHYKRKLTSLSKDLYLENDWDMPNGFIDPDQKNPLNFTRAEWEKAQRTGRDPREIKAAMQECWAISDSRKAFEQAMKERGFYLAKGDKKGLVAVDLYGKVYALTRELKVRRPDLEKRLGKPDTYQSVSKTKEVISEKLTGQFQDYFQEMKQKHREQRKPLAQEKKILVEQQRKARSELKAQQQSRWHQEELQRAQRLRKGFKGIWDRLTGTYQRTRKRNESEAQKAQHRDQQERQSVINQQIHERKQLQGKIVKLRDQQQAERQTFFKGMDRHYQNIERQQAIRELYEKEVKQKPRQDQKPDDGSDFEPQL